MDKITSIIAAFGAGKQPSQSQTNAWVEELLQSELIKVEQTSGGGELSQNGKKLARDLRSVLEAYKTYGAHKNGENLVQEAFWHLSQADIAASSLDVDSPMDSREFSNDYQAIASSLRTSLQVFWDNMTTEGSSVFSDFVSFTRLSLADAAEMVGEKSSQAAQKLRKVEDQVQAGERDDIGIKQHTKDSWKKADARETFEKSMDTAKDAGSVAIGTAQSASNRAVELTDRSRTRLQAAISTMKERAKEDPEYRRSLDALFNLIRKWLKAAGDVAADAAQSASLESFIKDPTPEKHLICAIRYMARLAQNIAGGKSLEDLYSALRVCVIDIRSDPDLQQWTDDYLSFAQRALEQVGDNDPEEISNTRQHLYSRWKELTELDSDTRRPWKENFATLRREVHEFQERVEQDKDMQAVRSAHVQFGRDLEEILIDATVVGLQAAISGTSWLWTDLFNVYLPRFVGMLKSIPIPRSEYVDDEIEFVLENLNISSIGFLPGSVFIRNITDVEITAPNEGASSTAVGSLTHVHAKGLQLNLSQLSFYYRDLKATVGPAEFTGLAEVTLPPEGVDVDIKVRLVPTTPGGLAERAERQCFLRVDHVKVNLSDDVDVRVTKSNHPVLLTVFRPLITARLRGALQTTLSENIRRILENADALVWDTTIRAEVFEDAGLSRGSALAAAWWSEVGRLRRTQGGLCAGLRATGSGIVRDGSNAKFALGAEPQVLGPEKHGPKGTLAKPLKERAREAGANVDVDVTMERGEGVAKDVVEQAGESAKAGLRKVRDFNELVAEKQEKEQSNPGWGSSAFDV